MISGVDYWRDEIETVDLGDRPALHQTKSYSHRVTRTVSSVTYNTPFTFNITYADIVQQGNVLAPILPGEIYSLICNLINDTPFVTFTKLLWKVRLMRPNHTIVKESDLVGLEYTSPKTHYERINLAMNEIIWSYDYGGRSKKRWPSKHDTIFWYAVDPTDYTFNYDSIDRVPYMAPELVGKEKADRGKVPTDVWWQTIVPTNGKERTGYPTQKPLAILNRIVKVHSSPGDIVLDFFGGSGTTGVAAATNDRKFVLVDANEEAVQIAATSEKTGSIQTSSILKENIY